MESFVRSVDVNAYIVFMSMFYYLNVCVLTVFQWLHNHALFAANLSLWSSITNFACYSNLFLHNAKNWIQLNLLPVVSLTCNLSLFPGLLASVCHPFDATLGLQGLDRSNSWVDTMGCKSAPWGTSPGSTSDAKQVIPNTPNPLIQSKIPHFNMSLFNSTMSIIFIVFLLKNMLPLSMR